MLHLDKAGERLLDSEGRVFLAAERRWKTGEGAEPGPEITAAEAVRWLQRDSGAPCRVPIGLIGGREITEAQDALAEEVGAGLAALGLTLICGGKGGAMAAACRGMARGGGLSIGLLPDNDWSAANPHVSIPIATGIGVARNAIIARASLCLIAVGGGYGTLSEVAFGLQFGRPVFALAGAPEVEGVRAMADWSALETALCNLVLALKA